MVRVGLAGTRVERMIRAFMAGVKAKLVDVRGYGLTATERLEYEAEAVAIYEPVVAA